MKTKLLIIVMAVVLFVNSYDLRVFASTDYDHDRLLEYDGYAEAMYESIVEQTTFISGRYTENKDYVNESINQITDYAKGWWNEYKTISELPPKEKIREMINAAGGYALTVTDFIKNLFNDYDETQPPLPQDFSGYQAIFDLAYASPNYALMPNKTFGANDGIAELHFPDGKSKSYWHPNLIKPAVVVSGTQVYYCVDDRYPRDYCGGSTNFSTSAQATSHVASVRASLNNFNAVMNYFISNGMYFTFTYNGGEKVEIPSSGGSKPSTIINNYLKDNPVQAVVPKPTAYLSCPDGTRINMKINGGTFLDVKGNIMQVDKNGTATVDSQICNLGWEKPKVQYIDETDQVGVSTPDGEIIDAETGDTITGGGDSEFDDEIQDGCGTLCALGKLLTGLGSIVKAIAAIPLKILDGLFELVKKIFIPEENFWTTNLDGLKDKFFHDELKEVQNGVESLETVGGGQFSDVNVSLLGVDNIKLIDSSPINMTLDTIHSWVRGFFYPLLLFFNINQMYRVIRGTSLIGIGGKKEE